MEDKLGLGCYYSVNCFTEYENNKSCLTFPSCHCWIKIRYGIDAVIPNLVTKKWKHLGESSHKLRICLVLILRQLFRVDYGLSQPEAIASHSAGCRNAGMMKHEQTVLSLAFWVGQIKKTSLKKCDSIFFWQQKAP